MTESVNFFDRVTTSIDWMNESNQIELTLNKNELVDLKKRLPEISSEIDAIDFRLNDGEGLNICFSFAADFEDKLLTKETSMFDHIHLMVEKGDAVLRKLSSSTEFKTVMANFLLELYSKSPKLRGFNGVKLFMQQWIDKTFEDENRTKKTPLKIVEEVLELAQSLDVDRLDVLEILNHVYSKPKGNTNEECADVILVLAALANEREIDLAAETMNMMNKIDTMSDTIREREQSKPHMTPNP